MSQFTASMFESIKETLETQKSGNGNFKDILKTKPGSTYLVRLVPNVKEPNRTIYKYSHHGWNSHLTGQYVTTLCPTMWGDRCPICEKRLAIWQSKQIDDDTKKKLGGDLKKKENWLVNAYVVKDPTTSENEGQIKIIRYGKQIDKIIDEAISGEDSDEFGARIFDLTKEGCNFRIKVEENEGGYPTYVSSRFLSPSPIEGLTKDKIDEIHENIFELDKVFDTKDTDAITEMLKDHYKDGLGSTTSAPTTKTVDKDTSEKMKDLVSELGDDDDTVEDTENDEDDSSEEEVKETADVDPEDIDDKINDLLADLD